MASKITPYHKSDSFADIRFIDLNRERVLDRVRRLRGRVQDLELTDDQARIVRKACDDICDMPSEGSKRRFSLKDHVYLELMRLPEVDLPRYLFYRYRYEMFPVQKLRDDFPPCLQIEPTSICNYRCVFCFQTNKAFTRHKNGHMRHMSLDLFKRVVDQAQGQCEAVTLASRGEPLLCPDIGAMISYLSGKFLGLKINTNAWYLNERMANAILQADFNTLVFSADAASEPLYSSMRVNGKLDRILANIERFQQIRARHYSETRLITRVSGVKVSGEQDIDEMETFWGSLVDEVAFTEYLPWENAYDQPPNSIETPCSDLWRRMFVWSDGRINPCDVDYMSTLSVGNANKDDLSRVWTGESYEALRAAHLSRQRSTLSPCNSCVFV